MQKRCAEKASILRCSSARSLCITSWSALETQACVDWESASAAAQGWVCSPYMHAILVSSKLLVDQSSDQTRGWQLRRVPDPVMKRSSSREAQIDEQLASAVVAGF